MRLLRGVETYKRSFRWSSIHNLCKLVVTQQCTDAKSFRTIDVIGSQLEAHCSPDQVIHGSKWLHMELLTSNFLQLWGKGVSGVGHWEQLRSLFGSLWGPCERELSGRDATSFFSI